MKPLSTAKKILICVMMIFIILIIGIILILINGSSSAKRYEQHLSLGDKYLTEMDYEKAIVEFVLYLTPRYICYIVET